MKFQRYIRRGWRAVRQLAWPDLLYFFSSEVRGYNKSQAKADTRAAVNVTLLMIPQVITYASIAGLSIESAFFGAAVAAIIGPLFGASRFIMLGPTNATAVLLFALFASLEISDPAEKAALLPLMLLISGSFLVLGSLIQVGQLIQYISRTVVTGYITAAAIYIMINQVPKALGLPEDAGGGTTIFQVTWNTITHISAVHWPSILCALATLAVMFALTPFKKKLPLVATVLVLVSLAFWPLSDFWTTLSENLTGPHMLPALRAESLDFTLPVAGFDNLGEIANIALVVAFLSFLEGSSIGKSLAARAGDRLDVNREMFAMGWANIGCAFYGGVPASGSLTRSQLNFESGAATALAGVLSGILCLAAVFVLGPLVAYIPVPALAVAVIFTGYTLINRRVIRVVMKSTKSDAVVFVTTFTAALLIRLDFAIILGVITSILLFLRKASIPELVEYTNAPDGALTPLTDKGQRAQASVSIVHVEGDLFFGASDLFRDQMRRLVEDPALKIVILKMRNAYHLDATSVLALEELVRYMQSTGRHLLISEARKEAIRIFKNSGLRDIIGRDNIIPDNLQNPTLATAHALKRAKQLLGGKTGEVSIYVDKTKQRSQV